MERKQRHSSDYAPSEEFPLPLTVLQTPEWAEEVDSREDFHASGACHGGTPEPGSKTLSYFDVSPVFPTDKT